ncbi:hypothetical protein D3C72_1339830 [compost metagenome]
MLGTAPSPEDHRRIAQPGSGYHDARAHGTVRRGTRQIRGLRGRGNGGIPGGRPRVLPDGDEHPPAGGASGDRGADGARSGGVADPRRPWRGTAMDAGRCRVARSCDRGAPMRRGRRLCAPDRDRAGSAFSVRLRVRGGGCSHRQRGRMRQRDYALLRFHARKADCSRSGPGVGDRGHARGVAADAGAGGAYEPCLPGGVPGPPGVSRGQVPGAIPEWRCRRIA